MSIVKIASVENSKIKFFGVDMLDGTPVLDIKPYIEDFVR
jgi:tRNA (Thr-GGU) A37 N-methylase